MTVGDKIKVLLSEEKIKPYILADIAKVDRSNVYDIINNKNLNPGIDVICKIANALCLDDEELGRLIR